MKKRIFLAGCILFLGSTAQAAPEPEAIFKQACGFCHNGQLPTAPKKGDTAAWELRNKQGMEVLVKHVNEGYNGMPPKGLCMTCSSDDFKAVIEWMAKP